MITWKVHVTSTSSGQRYDGLQNYDRSCSQRGNLICFLSKTCTDATIELYEVRSDRSYRTYDNRLQQALWIGRSCDPRRTTGVVGFLSYVRPAIVNSRPGLRDVFFVLDTTDVNTWTSWRLSSCFTDTNNTNKKLKTDTFINYQTE